MASQGFRDLDELIVACRNDQARMFIQEAVQCYRAGAYRQTIVATWIAVFYDIIFKLQELELSGDDNASQKIAEYERIRRENNIRGALNFEQNILDTAQKDFELISDVEHSDLTRLREDRNRCAHPVLNAFDEVYQPSAELARTHLRNAIPPPAPTIPLIPPSSSPIPIEANIFLGLSGCIFSTSSLALEGSIDFLHMAMAMMKIITINPTPIWPPDRD